MAGVLVLLFSRSSEVKFLLTARPNTLARHAGQISLPGGVTEPGDVDLWHTALRETREELGIRTGRIRPLGQLDPVSLVVSNYVIAPFVGWNPLPPALRPDPAEVAECIEVPLSRLFDPLAVQEEKWELRGDFWYVCFFRLDDRIVWGATARILADLASRLRRSAFREPLIPGSVRPA
jgi:8-oxo-dGTP pyrophosphatase MutT (NUDIX family)